jgi:[acyl-carrier-protein] S-malonyltransferase
MGHVAECGPGKVLAGLNKRIEPAQLVSALTDGAALKAAAAVLI